MARTFTAVGLAPIAGSDGKLDFVKYTAQTEKRGTIRVKGGPLPPLGERVYFGDITGFDVEADEGEDGEGEEDVVCDQEWSEEEGPIQ